MKRILMLLSALAVTVGLSAEKVVKFSKDVNLLLVDSTKTAIVLSQYNEDPALNHRQDDPTIIDSGYGRSYSRRTEVVIPPYVSFKGETYRVTCVGAKAYDCTQMPDTLRLPETITCIEPFAFHCCDSLRCVFVGGSVTRIGQGVFGKCPSLQDIHVASSNPDYCSVDGVLFSKDKKTLIRYPAGRKGAYKIPAGVRQIGWGAFLGCRGLTDVTIPASVTTIANSAFCNCRITKVTIPSSVTHIGAAAFYECGNLDTVICLARTPPVTDRQVYRIWKQDSVCAFGHYYEKWTVNKQLFVTDEQTAALYRTAGEWSAFDTIVPSLPKPPAKPKQAAAGKSTKLQPAIIKPEKNLVKYVQINGLFYELDTKAKTAVLTFDQKHTEQSYGFVHADVPSAVKYKGKMYSVVSIGRSAFALCDSLQSITIPESVTEIGFYAFAECRNLRTIRLPKGLKEIFPHTFKNCESLDSVYIPDNVDYIGDYAFSECYHLQSVHLPDSLLCASYGAFYGCFSLSSVTIPRRVRNMLAGAFTACFGMQSFNADAQSDVYCSVNGVLYSKDTTCIVNYPAGRWDSVYVIPRKVNMIRRESFICSQLQTVVIPPGVTYIGYDAFAYCMNLKQLVCYAVTPPECPGYLFGETPKSVPKIYVPAESIELYRTAKGWGDRFVYLPLSDNTAAAGGE